RRPDTRDSKQHRRAAPCNRLLFQNEQCRWRVLNRAAEAKPGCQRNSPRALHRNISEIESDHSETVALQQQIGDFQHLLQLRFPAPGFWIFPSIFPSRKFPGAGACSERVAKKRCLGKGHRTAAAKAESVFSELRYA